jgi:hypothetical protein
MTTTHAASGMRSTGPAPGPKPALPPSTVKRLPSVPESGGSAHIASVRDHRARARLVRVPGAVRPLAGASSPNWKVYFEGAPLKSSMPNAARKALEERIQQDVISLGHAVDQAGGITSLLRFYANDAWAELPAELDSPGLRKENLFLRSEPLSKRLIARLGAGDKKAATVLRAYAVAYVAAAYLHYSVKEFRDMLPIMNAGKITKFLEVLLLNTGIDGLRLLRELENYLVDEKGVTNPTSLKTYRKHCAQLMRSGMEVFATSTVYPQAQRAYAWSLDAADTCKVIQHRLAAMALRRKPKQSAPAKPSAEQTQTTRLTSIDGAKSSHAWRHQLETIARHMAHVTQFRLHLQNPDQTASSPAAAAAAQARQQEICIAASETKLSADQQSLIFPTLDLSYLTEPAAGNKRNAGQAFPDSAYA